MARHLRTLLFVVLVLAASGISAGTTLAAIAPGCANPVDSALNQYCDSIPGSAGTRSPQAGTPSVATTLPPAAVARIRAAGASSDRGGRRQARARRQRSLLSLPAPGPGHRLTNSRAEISEGAALPLWLILVLIGSAVAMTAVTLARRAGGRDGS